MNAICKYKRKACERDGCVHAVPHDPIKECSQIKCNGTEKGFGYNKYVECVPTTQAKKIGTAIAVSLLWLACMSCQSPILGSDGKPKDAKNLQHDEHTVPVGIVVE